MIARRDAARRAAQDRRDNAPAVQLDALSAAFDNAAKSRAAKRSENAKAPRLRIADFVISPAKSTSQNAGALYVKQRGGAYLGKVQNGRFFASRECSE